MDVPDYPGKDILDAACGSKMFWWDSNRQRDDVLYMDSRQLDATLCDGRELHIHPDVLGDFRRMPFPDGRFAMVVFDPPHIDRGQGWMAQKYGTFGDDWKADLKKGFEECMRVLIPGGFIVFKWFEASVSFHEVTKCFPCDPLFGTRRPSKDEEGRKCPIWLVFRKEVARCSPPASPTSTS